MPELPERRRRALTDDDLQALAAVFESTRAMPQDLHRKHHEFVDRWIEKEKRKSERWERTKTHVMGWGIVTAIGGIGYSVFEWLKSSLK